LRAIVVIRNCRLVVQAAVPQFPLVTGKGLSGAAENRSYHLFCVFSRSKMLNKNNNRLNYKDYNVGSHPAYLA